MAASSIGVIYDRMTLKVTRVIIPDDDGELADPRCQPTEALIRLDRAKWSGDIRDCLAALVAEVEARLGQ